MLGEVIDSIHVARRAIDHTNKLVHLDNWPPDDARAVALDVLDPDEAPDDDEVSPSAKSRMASILLALDAHRTFEAGRAHVLASCTIGASEVDETTSARASVILDIVGSSLRIGSGIDEDAIMPSLQAVLRPLVEREAQMGSTIMQLRDVLYPGGSGGADLGGEELSMVNNIMRTMGFGPTDGRDGPDDKKPDEGDW